MSKELNKEDVIQNKKQSIKACSLSISSENLMRNILTYVSIARPFLLAQERFCFEKLLYNVKDLVFLRGLHIISYIFF